MNKNKFIVLIILVSLFFLVGNDVPKVYAVANTWKIVGSEQISAEHARSPHLAFNPSTYEPYIVYDDESAAEKVTVMKYDGVSWTVVGSAGFSAGLVNYADIAFNPSTNIPYVAFSDGGYSGKARVMKYNGTSWEDVGNAGFSSEIPYYIQIRFNPSTNEPYVVFEDGDTSTAPKKATVMKFDGSSWQNVGAVDFTGTSSELSLAFNPSTNEPYVVYSNLVNEWKINVMKFNGASWENVGAADFSTGFAYRTGIAFNPATNEPYVIYTDSIDSNHQGVAVKKFDGSSWVYVGNLSYDAGNYSNPSISFGIADKLPYISYLNSAALIVKKNDGLQSYWQNVGSVISNFYDTSIIFNPLTTEPYLVGTFNGGARVMRFSSNSVDDPVFSPGSGTYYGSQSINISSATQGSDIYYSTDGNYPNLSSNKYQGAITAHEATLKAFATKYGKGDSDVVTASYVFPPSIPQSITIQ